MADRAEVRNAADREQVTRAGRREREREVRRLAIIRGVLETTSGREFCWNLLTAAGVFKSVWHSSALIHYNSGRQDFGHELMADLIRADEGAYELMNREARERARRANAETEAAHTATATTEDNRNDDTSGASRST